LPLGKVDKSDGAGYLKNLKIFKETGNIDPFVKFMSEKYVALLQMEIRQNKENLNWNMPKNKQNIPQEERKNRFKL
jgi:hypothetical protein